MVLNKDWIIEGGGSWVMKDLITEIVQALVDQPEEVSVRDGHENMHLFLLNAQP